MSLRVCVLVPARNEARRLGALLESVAGSLAGIAESGLCWQSEVVVVLDRCTDCTERVASQHGAQVLRCPAPFGKVEALRLGMTREADVFVCVDADVVLGPRTLRDLVEALLRVPTTLASCPPLMPEPLSGLQTPLAWALYRYNAARGFSRERLWLSGRCYAVRRVAFPAAAELRARAVRWAPDARVQTWSASLQAEDVWLSRSLLARHPNAIVHVQTDPVQYRAPSSWRGMSRTHRRLRRELRRIDLLFPELPGPGRDRQIDRALSLRDRLALAIFDGALWLCRLHARVEDALPDRLAAQLDPWPVVRESKR